MSCASNRRKLNFDDVQLLMDIDKSTKNREEDEWKGDNEREVGGPLLSFSKKIRSNFVERFQILPENLNFHG